jgi:hypothetical protein
MSRNHPHPNCNSHGPRARDGALTIVRKAKGTHTITFKLLLDVERLPPRVLDAC